MYNKWSSLSDCTVKCAAGLLRILWSSSISDATIAPSSIPAACDYMKDVDEFVESIDGWSGVIQPTETELVVKDSHSVHAEGVFHKMIRSGTTQVMIAFSDDSGTTWSCIHTGVVSLDRTSFDYDYWNGVKYIKTARIGIKTSFAALEGATADVVTDLNARGDAQYDSDQIVGTATLTYAWWVKMIELFRSSMYVAFGSSNIDSYATCVQLPAGDNDINFRVDATNRVNIDDVYILTKWYTEGSYYYSRYFDNADSLDLGFAQRYPTIREFLNHNARELGFMWRIWYGVADGTIDFTTMSNNKYWMQLLNRGQQQSAANYVTMSEEKTATENLSTTLRAINLTVTHTAETAGAENTDAIDEENVYIVKNYWYGGVTFTLWPIYTMMFTRTTSPNRLNIVYGQSYFNYQTGLRTNPALTDMSYVIGTFYRARWTASSKGFEKTYRGIGATAGGVYSSRNIYPGVCSLVNSDDANVSHYANEVRKNVMTNELTVVWLIE